MKNKEKVIEIKELGKILGMEEKDLQDHVKAFANTKKKAINMDEIVRTIIGYRLSDLLNCSKTEIKKILDENNLCFSNRTEIVRIYDNGYLVMKLRLKQFNQALLTKIEQGLIDEVEPVSDEKISDDEEKKEE